jgi:hypothetical protein
MLSTVLILPNAYVATGDAVGEAMGWGPRNFSIPLSADGSEPATHTGLHAWSSDDFPAMLESRIPPPAVLEAGVTVEEYDAMLDALISSFWADYVGHFDTVCAENGLTIVEPATEDADNG